ncbi:hypothetical protein [Escherichia coli]|uniref:hypothetical protein n=1 Tax=Escherichia coli TaxID=562 RepID=UPI000DA5D405|nr:terminase small subunit [Escherichia coli]SQM12224.1 terminase small subunit [Escherichia coli]SQM26862.1 terminase small subunit [Escherichia coli]SQS27320.1 terminase small subunit [Escherichia coli]
MAKQEWNRLQQQSLSAHAATGILPKDWCEAQGLNYASAKRYIKIANGSANSQKKLRIKLRIRRKPFRLIAGTMRLPGQTAQYHHARACT